MLPSSASHSSNSADLSISELSLSDRSTSSSSSARPFSLLARPPTPSTPVQTRRSDLLDDDELGDDDGEQTQRAIDVDSERDENYRRIAAKMREDRLQNDVFVLRKLNAAFSSFNEALEDVGSANERISQQLEQTESLLNKYVDILDKSESFSRLIFDDEWEGAEMDELVLEHEHREAIERARREAEERALAEQREAQRLEREAKERQEQEEKERIEREKKDRAISRGGVRGVRGTRASMRGMRGTVPSARGAAISSSSSTVRGRTPSTSGPTRAASRGSGITRGTTRGG